MNLFKIQTKPNHLFFSNICFHGKKGIFYLVVFRDEPLWVEGLWRYLSQPVLVHIVVLSILLVLLLVGIDGGGGVGGELTPNLLDHLVLEGRRIIQCKISLFKQFEMLLDLQRMLYKAEKL